jgi:NAD+ kinase
VIGPVRRVNVITHRRPRDIAPALGELRKAAAEAGVELCFSEEETQKHDLQNGAGLSLHSPVGCPADLALVLGGDGTILQALRTYLGSGTPVFAVNYGEVGFLATVEPDQVPDAFRRALAGNFEVMDLPAIIVDGHEDVGWTAINDVSFHRQPGLRVADLSYAVGDEEIGRVRSDGIVVSTPAGSTGYNLANGGPVMAWGVEGYAVSFIAPHSLTARALVVAPQDTLSVSNRSREEPIDVTVDGRPISELAAGESLRMMFRDGCGKLAQVPGASFYHRLREKFGRLAS